MTQSALAYDWIDNEQLIASTDLHTCRNARNNGSEEKSQRGSAVEGSQNRRLHTHQCTDSCKSIPQSIPTHHTTSESIPRASPEHPQSIPHDRWFQQWKYFPTLTSRMVSKASLRISKNLDLPPTDRKNPWESSEAALQAQESQRIPKHDQKTNPTKPDPSIE